VAYQYFPVRNGRTAHQLRLAELGRAGKPRVLVDDVERVNNIYPIAWSSDARRVLVEYEIPVPAGSSRPRIPPGGAQGDFQLSWVTVADGTMTPVKQFEWWRSAGENDMGLMSLSPDRRLLAYSAVPTQGSPERSIYVMGIDGGTPVEMVSGGVNESPVWTPDGRHLVFVSDRGASYGVWRLRVENGKPNGFISPVKPNTGRVALHGFTAAGVLYYAEYTRLEETFVAPISRDGRLGPRVAPTESTPGNNAVWSPDGKLLAFKRRNSDRRFEVVVRSMDTGKEMKWSGSRADGQPVGNSLMFWTGSSRVVVAPQTVLEVVGQELRRAGDVSVPHGSLSRDGSLIYAPGGEKDARVNLFDASTGQQKGSLPLPEAVAAVALSPTGDMIALVNPRRLAIIRVDGSDYRELLAAPPSLLPSVKWAGDGRSLLYTTDDGKQLRMMRVALSGGSPEPGGLVGSNAIRFDISPDGTRIAYTNRREAVEVWSLRVPAE
jgi:hypothetical protein